MNRGDRKIALVTGGTGVLGSAFVYALAEDGYDIALQYCSSHIRANEIKDSVSEMSGAHVELMRADFSDPEGGIALTANYRQSFGRLDLFLHAASYFPARDSISDPEGGILQESRQTWQRCMSINAMSLFFLFQGLAKMIITSNGLAVLVSDESVYRNFLTRAAYTVSRRAEQSIASIVRESFRGALRVEELVLGFIVPPQGVSDGFGKRWEGADEAVKKLRAVIR